MKSLINFYTQGQHQKALTKASQLLLQYPSSIILYNILGVANTGLGKLEESIEEKNWDLVQEVFEELIEMNLDNPYDDYDGEDWG